MYSRKGHIKLQSVQQKQLTYYNRPHKLVLLVTKELKRGKNLRLKWLKALYMAG